MTQRGAEQPQVYGITGARSPHSSDLERRVSRYLISMAVRTACVILIFVVHGPLRWVFVAGAVVLPYVAVVFANASGGRRGVPTSSPVDRRGLTPTAVGDAGPAVHETGSAVHETGPVLLTGIVEPPLRQPER